MSTGLSERLQLVCMRNNMKGNDNYSATSKWWCRRCWLVLCVAMLQSGCEKHQETKGPTDQSWAAYVELYSVSATQDESHSRACTDADGNTWYRSNAPGVNLADCVVNSAVPIASRDGEYHVTMNIKADSALAVTKWTEACVGQWIGCFLNGELVAVDRIKVPFRSAFSIPGFETLEEANAVATQIRSMGP